MTKLTGLCAAGHDCSGVTRLVRQQLFTARVAG